MSCLAFLLSFFFVFACSLHVFLVNSQEDNSRQSRKHVAMFVFGDSLYDPGNNNFINVSVHFKADRWPYGESFFKYPTGRFCDGLTLPDFIALKANLPLWTPYLQSGRHQFSNGANFASAASGVLPETNPGTISLGLQVDYYKNVIYQLKQELGEEEANKLLMEAVYISSTGGNDYQVFYVNNATSVESEPEKYVQIVIGNLTSMIKEIYEMGGRKFGFQNIGPMGCLPLFKEFYDLAIDQCLEELLVLASLHNVALLQAVEDLESQLPGFKYSIFDFYTAFYDLIQNPTKYGFLVSDVACCGSGLYNGENCGIVPYNLCGNVSEHVFFDGAHPTQGANPYFAELFWSGESPMINSFNLKQLFELESDFSSRKYNRKFSRSFDDE